MARPKRIVAGTDLQLYVPLETKRKLFALANGRGQSMSAVVAGMIQRAYRRQHPESVSPCPQPIIPNVINLPQGSLSR